jgi:hypothetical protein
LYKKSKQVQKQVKRIKPVNVPSLVTQFEMQMARYKHIDRNPRFILLAYSRAIERACHLNQLRGTLAA